jgi:hypothetical protein
VGRFGEERVGIDRHRHGVIEVHLRRNGRCPQGYFSNFFTSVQQCAVKYRRALIDSAGREQVVPAPSSSV